MSEYLPATWWHDLSPISLAESEKGSDGLTRSWVMLMPQRVYTTQRYGKLNFSEPELRKYIASFDAKARGIEIALDADHQAANKNETQAYGWFERLALGEDIGRKPGLWAYVRWTKLGEEAVRGQIYRYMSAEITPGTYLNDTSGTKHHHVVMGATLTNRPVLKDIEPVTLSGRSKGSKGWPAPYTEGDGGNTEGTTKTAQVGRRGAMAAEDQELEDDETQELAELDDSGDDSEEYADSEDAADGGVDDEEEGDMPAPKAKAKAKAKKMSEGGLTLAEQQQLVEKVRRLERANYEQSVAAILGGWEAGKQQFSEQRAAAKAKPNGEAAKPIVGGRPVKVVLSPVAMRAAKKLLLSEDFAELSEELRGEFARVIELAATGAVDLSVRGGNSDTERVKTTRLSVVKPASDGAAFDAAWLENTVALAEAAGDDYAALVKLSAQNTRSGREAAEKVEQYQARARVQTLAEA